MARNAVAAVTKMVGDWDLTATERKNPDPTKPNYWTWVAENTSTGKLISSGMACETKEKALEKAFDAAANEEKY